MLMVLESNKLEEQIKNLKLELQKEKVKSATFAANVLSLEHTVSDLKSATVNSWEVLGYGDLRNKKEE